MGLGSLDTVSLADARAKASDCRKLIEQGRDPIEARIAQRAASEAQAAKAVTFDRLCRKLYRLSWRRMAECKACRTVGKYFGNLCIANIRQAPSPRH